MTKRRSAMGLSLWDYVKSTSVAWVVLLSWIAILALPGTAWAEDKLVLSGDAPTVYVQSGTQSVVKVAVTNNSGAAIKGVTLVDGSTIDSVTHTDGHDQPFHPARFSRGNAEGRYAMDGELIAAENATHELDQQGYRIARGRTATFTIRVHSYEEAPATYTEWLQLGDIEIEQYEEDGYTRTRAVAVETYSARIPVKVVVYNPKNAALAFGTTSTQWGADFTPPPATIDLGTISLTDEGALSSNETYYARNTSPAGNDEHGNSPDIHASLGLENAEETPFSLHNEWYSPRSDTLEPGTNESYGYISTNLCLDAEDFIAGTYTANFVLSTKPHGVKVNGAAIQTSGRYVWPVRVTLTGTNPRLPKRVNRLDATAGNGLVELTFVAQEGAFSYNVYRREGEETQTDADKLDWSKYERIAEAKPNEEGLILFVDGTVENGKTYSYTVICGEPYRGYAAKPVTARPDSSLMVKLLAPEGVSANDELGGVELGWEMNALYGGDQNSGASMVDHFNIYRDGVLVAQVDQSAVSDVVSHGWISTDGGETYHYGVSGHEYGWTYFLETPQLYTDCVWNVSAVTQSGVEGYWSKDVVGQGTADKPVIYSHKAQYDPYYDNYEVEGTDEWADIPALCLHIDVQQDGYVENEETQWWRATGTKAPDTSKAPYATFSKDEDGHNGCDFNDTSITAGTTYTYTVRVRDEKGDWSGYYTFTCKAQELDGVNDGYNGFGPVSVTWKIISGGTKASMAFVTGEVSTCKIYRNDEVVKTFTNVGDTVSYIDDPGTDGTFTYRVDRTVAGITSRGRDYVFVRNTAPVDESTFGRAPAAPTLTARTSGSCVILDWQPSTAGGEPDGYYIYRKDAGELVEGSHQAISHHWYGDETYSASWGNSRYLKIQDADVHTLVDGRSGNYLGDASLGILEGISWDDGSLPHEWYVTAYNARGESAPSNVIVYDTSSEDQYGNTSAPANEGVDSLPGKPEITRMWVEWDDSTYASGWGSVSGHVRVAWNDTPGDLIDHWNVYTSGTCTHWSEPDMPDVLEYWEAACDPALTQGGQEFTHASLRAWNENPDENDIGRTVTMSVEAANGIGAVRSDEMQVTVRSIPRFRVLPDNGSALLEWTDLVCDTTTQVNAWQMWRRREHGTWQLVETLAAPLDYAATDKDGVSSYAWRDTDVENGWTYEYKVVASCVDGIDRASVVREVTPDWAAATEAPGKPTNLRCNVVNGIMYFTWDAPTTGGTVGYYQVMFEDWINYPEDLYWNGMGGSLISGTSTSSYYQPSRAGTYKCFVYSYNYVRGQRLPVPYSDWYNNPLPYYEEYPTCSNVVTVTITEDDLAAQASIPDLDWSTEVTLTPGEGQITVGWTADPGAARYELVRYNKDGSSTMPRVTIAAVSGQETYSYVDETAQSGVRYRYVLSVERPGGGGYSRDGYATARGKSKDAQVAEQVEELIAALPDPGDVDEGNATQVAEVVEVWDSLTDAQKKLVDPALAEKLENDADKVEAMDLADQYGELVAQVQALVDALPAPEDVTLADSTAIRSARTTLNNLLPKKARALVDTTRLVADEAKLDELQKYAQYAEAAAEVQIIIDALPDADAVTLADADAIEAARAAYDGLLPDDAKRLVKVGRLTDAEARLEQLRIEEQYGAEAAPVQQQVTALPDADAVTLDDAAAIEAARSAYEALSTEAKKLVDVARLEAAEQALAAAREQAAGHDLANATIDPIDTYIWYGGEVVPEVVVLMDGTALAEGADYELVFENNDHPGTASVTAMGMGAFEGSKKASFKVILPFTDVKWTADGKGATSHLEDVLWMADAGITRGWGEIPNATFKPYSNVARADMAAFLFRLAQRWGALGASEQWQPSEQTRAKFIDVNDKTAHAREIWWMAEMGISTGWPIAGTEQAEFKPYAHVARADMAAFLGRLASGAAVGNDIAGDPSAFVDVSERVAHCEEIWWMASAGISTGWELDDGTAEFRPYAQIKRCDMAAFIHRLDALV